MINVRNILRTSIIRHFLSLTVCSVKEMQPFTSQLKGIEQEVVCWISLAKRDLTLSATTVWTFIN